jgi:hypothetical protein
MEPNCSRMALCKVLISAASLGLVHMRYWRVWFSRLQTVTGADNSVFPVINQAETLLFTGHLYYNIALSRVGKF